LSESLILDPIATCVPYRTVPLQAYLSRYRAQPRFGRDGMSWADRGRNTSHHVTCLRSYAMLCCTDRSLRL